jgi:hypothetical protein
VSPWQLTTPSSNGTAEEELSNLTSAQAHLLPHLLPGISLARRRVESRPPMSDQPSP